MELFENLPSLQSTTKTINTNEDNRCSIKNKPLSLVDSIGSAGTPMAFVPSSLLQQRKKKLLISEIQKGSEKIEQVNFKNNIKTHGRSSCQLHLNAITVNNNSSPIKQSSADPNDFSETHIFTLDSEKMRDLHSSISPSQSYDPKVPNDYLKYKEQRKSELLRKEYERKALETLKKQQKLQEMISEERKKAELDGRVDKIIESRLGSYVDIDSINMNEMRGRGGASNLPAWLIQKRRNELAKRKQTNNFFSKYSMLIKENNYMSKPNYHIH